MMNETRCFFYGLAVGAAAGVLMAPRSGVKTRALIADTAREGQGYVAREVAEKLDRTKRAAKATADGIGVALEVGREKLMG
jgi:gas vesicle protein